MFSFLAIFSSFALAFDTTGVNKAPDDFLACHKKVILLAQEENKDKHCFIGVVQPGYRSVICNSDINDKSLNDNSKVPFIGLSGLASLKVDNIKTDIMALFFWKLSSHDIMNTLRKEPTCKIKDLSWWHVI